MKTYYLSYTTITGHKVNLFFPQLFAFSEALEKAINDEYVNQHTIEFRTEEK